MSTRNQNIEAFLNQHSSSVFSHPLYAQILHPEQYDFVSANDKGGNIVAALPFVHYRNKGLHRISMPAFAQYTPLSFVYPEGISNSKKFSFQAQIIAQIVDNLPIADHYLFRLPFHHQNVLPFVWNGFETSIRYSFILSRGFTAETVLKKVQSSVRRKIKQLNNELTVESSTDADLLFELTNKNYAFKNMKNPYSREEYERLLQFGFEQNCCAYYIAKNSSGRVIGTHVYLWDQDYVHYLVGATDPEFRNAGASTFLIWKGIELAAEKNLSFNFEGSMDENIALFFSKFNAKLTPYYSVEKYRNGAIRFLLKNLRKKKS